MKSAATYIFLTIPMQDINTFLQYIFGLYMAAVIVFFGFSLFLTNGKEESSPIDFPKNLVLWLILIGLAFNIFLFDLLESSQSWYGIGLGIFGTILFSALYLTLPAEKKSRFTLSLSILGSLACLATSYRANSFLLEFNVFVAEVSMALMLLTVTFKKIRWEAGWFFKNMIHFFPAFFAHSTVLAEQSVRLNKDSKSVTKVVLRGILIAVALLIVFANLLAQADPVFASLLEKYQADSIDRILGTLALLIVFVFLVTLRAKATTDESTPFKALHFYDFAIPAFVIDLLFLCFIFIQIKYLFGANESIVNFDITYSDYVRKGFLELMIIGFLGALMSYAMTLKTHALEAMKQMRVLKGLNIILLLELFAILASALQRDLIYMDAYGLTRVRFIGLFLLAWIAGLLVINVIFTLMKGFSERRWFTSLFILSILGFFTLNIVNVDQWISEKSENKDYFYINNLSTDASSAWDDSLSNAETVLNSLSENTTLSDEGKEVLADTQVSLFALSQKVSDLEAKYSVDSTQPWSKWNYSESLAFQQIEAKPELYHEKLSCLLKQVDLIQFKTFSELQEERSKRFSAYEYPLTEIDNLNFDQNDYTFDTIAKRLFEEAGMLELMVAKYGTGTLSPEVLKKDEYGLMKQFEASSTSISCKF